MHSLLKTVFDLKKTTCMAGGRKCINAHWKMDYSFSVKGWLTNLQGLKY